MYLSNRRRKAAKLLSVSLGSSYSSIHSPHGFKPMANDFNKKHSFIYFTEFMTSRGTDS